MEKNVPLSGGFMAISIVGFFISLFMVYNKGYRDWGVALMLVFIIMFVASLVSVHNVGIEAIRLMDRKDR